MWSTETVLTFIVVPLAITGAIYASVYLASARKARRYRPGRPFEFAPVWFTAAESAAEASSPQAALPAASPPELPAGPTVSAFGAPSAEFESQTGGASDSW